MKKFFSLLLAFFLMLSSASASTLDFSSFSDDELILIRDTVLAEIQKRGLIKSANVPVGSYVVGEDFPAGVYSVKAHSYASIIEVYASQSADRSIFRESCYENDLGIGKLELKENQILVIQVGGAVFSEYVGIFFN